MSIAKISENFLSLFKINWNYDEQEKENRWIIKKNKQTKEKDKISEKKLYELLDELCKNK